MHRDLNNEKEATNASAHNLTCSRHIKYIEGEFKLNYSTNIAPCLFFNIFEIPYQTISIIGSIFFVYSDNPSDNMRPTIILKLIAPSMGAIARILSSVQV